MSCRPRRLPFAGLAGVLVLVLSVLTLAPQRASAHTTQVARPLTSPPVHFVWTVTPASQAGPYGSPEGSIIDNPASNNQPGAELFVTPNINPGELCGCVLDPHPIFVWDDGFNWVIQNADAGLMPIGATFNVLVIPQGAGGAWVFYQIATTSNTFGDSTYIDDFLTNGAPLAQLLITQHRGTSGPAASPQNFGVWYDNSFKKWAIFSENRTPIPAGTTFNVMVQAWASGGGTEFYQTATTSNTTGGTTVIDNSVTDGDPNAIVFVTPNWNPGGACGCIYDNDVLSVGYQGGTLLFPGHWTVFNEYGTSMPIGASFNVLAFSS